MLICEKKKYPNIKTEKKWFNTILYYVKFYFGKEWAQKTCKSKVLRLLLFLYADMRMGKSER